MENSRCMGFVVPPPQLRFYNLAKNFTYSCSLQFQLLKNSENSSLLEDKKLPCMSDWPTDSKKRIELAFSDKLKMPEDFYEFYEFCLTLNRGNPLDALVATCGLKLVGPFEFLLTPMERKAQSNNSGNYTCVFNGFELKSISCPAFDII
jgi:hypothetical protein